MKTVLVTGAGGYLGSVLCGKLLGAGYEVRGMDRFLFGEDKVQAYEKNPAFRKIRDDSRFISEDSFENVWAVIDLAGISNDPACDLDPYITKSINFDGAIRCARMAKESGVERYIYSSSCSVYGNGKSTDLDETSSLEPVSLYAKLKAQVEAELLQLQSDTFSVTILRNATIYGLSPRMRFDLVVNLMTLYAWKNRKIQVLGGGQQWRPWSILKTFARPLGLFWRLRRLLFPDKFIMSGPNSKTIRFLR